MLDQVVCGFVLSVRSLNSSSMRKIVSFPGKVKKCCTCSIHLGIFSSTVITWRPKAFYPSHTTLQTPQCTPTLQNTLCIWHTEDFVLLTVLCWCVVVVVVFSSFSLQKFIICFHWFKINRKLSQIYRKCLYITLGVKRPTRLQHSNEKISLSMSLTYKQTSEPTFANPHSLDHFFMSSTGSLAVLFLGNF